MLEESRLSVYRSKLGTFWVSHVELSLKQIEGLSWSPNLLKLIYQHHENYDGSGYPNGASGEDILESAQLLHLADWFDHLVTGSLTGEAVSPADAFDQIYKFTQDEFGPTPIQPMLARKVLRFIKAKEVDEKEQSSKVKD